MNLPAKPIGGGKTGAIAASLTASWPPYAACCPEKTSRCGFSPSFEGVPE
ncbi:MAG: hypothetical protein Q7T05_07995 [Dehalococcoidia bacterium]|nr:hypothetical protein [Dehalococcoidia bacterium]